MSGLRPGFITGANAKVKSNAKTIAYCTDVSYTITVQTIPIEVFGRYEPVSNEPVAYACEGTFNVIRYTANSSANVSNAKAPDGMAANGNDPNQVQATSATTHQDMLNPANILGSETFDLDIIQMLAVDAANKETQSETAVFRVQDCRLTRRGATLTKRGVLVDSYAFVGIIAGDTKTDNSDFINTANSVVADQT